MQYSIVQKNNLDEIVFRLDAEYYHPDHIELQKKLEEMDSVSLCEGGGELDCSAFYPSITPHYNFERKGIPFLRVNEIQDGLLFLSEDTAFLPQNILDENKTTIAICYPEDIIIAKGGNSLAKVALLTGDYKTYSVSRDVIVFRTNGLSTFNKFYLWIFLNSEIGKKMLLRTASQTGQPHLTLEAINQLRVPLISQNFQINFEEIYKKSQLLKKNSERLAAEAKDLLLNDCNMSDWQPSFNRSFIENFSRTKSLNRIDAEHYQPKYTELKKKIAKYSLGPLKDYFELISCAGQTYDENGSFGVLKTKQVLNGYMTYKAEDFTNLEANEVEKTLKDEDIIFTSMGVGSLGRSALHLQEYCSEKFTIDSTLKIFRQTSKDFFPEVLQVYLESAVGQELIYQNIVGSSGIINIYEDYIKEIPLPLIKKETQNLIKEKIRSSFKDRARSKILIKNMKKSVEIAIYEGKENAAKLLKDLKKVMEDKSEEESK